MPAKLSAGLLLYRVRDEVLEVMIAHMGGPFWAKKDLGAWSIPKGEYDDGEAPFDVAKREFFEELGSPPPSGEYLELGQLRQPSGKRITVWAIEAEFDATNIVSNTFTIENPKGSGNLKEFPEVDRAAWYDCEVARTKLLKGQVPFLDLLKGRLVEGGASVRESFGTLM